MNKTSLKYFLLAALCICLMLVGCKDKLKDESRYFFVSYRISTSNGYSADGNFRSVGTLRSIDYFEDKVVSDRSCRDGVYLTKEDVVILAVIEMSSEADLNTLMGPIDSSLIFKDCIDTGFLKTSSDGLPEWTTTPTLTIDTTRGDIILKNSEGQPSRLGIGNKKIEMATGRPAWMKKQDTIYIYRDTCGSKIISVNDWLKIQLHDTALYYLNPRDTVYHDSNYGKYSTGTTKSDTIKNNK